MNPRHGDVVPVERDGGRRFQGGPGRARLGLRAVLFLLAAWPVLGVELRAWERQDVLHAIHQVENPTNTTKVGRRGELGPYQFRPAVWFTHTDKPFELAADPAEADAVAALHYDWIVKGLRRNGVEVTPYHIGLAWNAGLSATINGRAGKASRRYAQRVANIVESVNASAQEVAQR